MGNDRVKYYNECPNKPLPVEICGRCPVCHTSKSKIIWGWHGVYYDMLCENGHDWEYKFPVLPIPEERVVKNGAGS